MDRKLKNDESLQGPDPIKPPPEQQKGARLHSLSPADLIPAGLGSIPGVTGALQVTICRSLDHIEFVITDDARVSLRQIESRFAYFSETDLAEFPELSLGGGEYARPVAYVSMREISPDILYVDTFEIDKELRSKGAGLSFEQHLVSLARKQAYKFQVGYQNDAEIARFFLNRGRYLLEEIKEELLGEFEALKGVESNPAVYYTILFLNPDDIAKYIKPERIGTSVEDKIEFKEKVLVLGEVFAQLSERLKRVEGGQKKRW